MTGAHREQETGVETDDELDDGSGDSALESVLESVWRPVQYVIDVWMVVVRAFSWLTARIVAILVFVVGFVPYALVMRLVRFDPLDRDLDPDATSYLGEPPATNRELDDFRKQY